MGLVRSTVPGGKVDFVEFRNVTTGGGDDGGADGAIVEVIVLVVFLSRISDGSANLSAQAAQEFRLFLRVEVH